MLKYVFNCWKTLKLIELQRDLKYDERDSYESRKNQLDGAWLNPKH